MFSQCRRLAWACKQPNQAGFSLLEMAFVLVLFGILVSFVAPTLSFMHHKSMAEEDRRTLQTLKNALIGQILSTGLLPSCLNAANQVVDTNCDSEATLGTLGVRWKDSRNSPFVYDVINASAYPLAIGVTAPTVAPTASNLCSRLDAVIAAASTTTTTSSGSGGNNGNANGTGNGNGGGNGNGNNGNGNGNGGSGGGTGTTTTASSLSNPAQAFSGPRICNKSPEPNDPAPTTTYCTAVTPVAFVLVGTGANRPGQNGEVEHSGAGVLGNENLNQAPADRIFDNPARRQFGNYDDLVEVVSLGELRAAAKCP